jgi:hypothetical protein
VKNVVKRTNKCGNDVKDAPRCRCLTKITKAKRKRNLEVVDENLRLSLQEITNTSYIGLYHFNVTQKKKKFSSCPKISRKSLFWKPMQNQRYKEFAQRLWQWNLQQWGRMVFINKLTIGFDPHPARMKVSG